MPSSFRIHPALGVARVGDADGDGFLGPERPGVPANWNFETATFDKFKSGGQIKRQGVRFRVFEFDESGQLVGEVLPGERGVTSIDWTVHVANNKASFFNFDGTSGEDGHYIENGLRNEIVKGAARQNLEIDPGPKSVSGKSAAPVVLTNPNAATNKVIKDLGDIRTDDAGRLVFFGGHGKTLQQKGASPIQSYVNNDGWFDDVSDGPISARIQMADGPPVDAVGAWVSVGPPDFAPAVANVVSLYEAMWDVAVRHDAIAIPDLGFYREGGAVSRLRQQRADWNPGTNRFNAIRASFVQDVAHLLQRAFQATFVHDPKDIKTAYHNTIAPQVWVNLCDVDPLKDKLRKEVFDRLRDPNSTEPAESWKMPRGLGDEYCDEDADGAGSVARLNSKRFFSLTPTQYAMLALWAARQFDADGTAPPSIPSTPPPISPEGLDRAALENCVGGPFYPGIECSWTIRNPVIYAEPFRLRLGAKVADGNAEAGVPDITVRAGFLTQQMALPWQADFRECKKEAVTNTKDGTPSFAMWWAGQRPDDVFPEATPDEQVPWLREPHFTASNTDSRRYREIVAHWSKPGFVALRDPNDDRRWLETERT